MKQTIDRAQYILRNGFALTNIAVRMQDDKYGYSYEQLKLVSWFCCGRFVLAA